MSIFGDAAVGVSGGFTQDAANSTVPNLSIGITGTGVIDGTAI